MSVCLSTAAICFFYGAISLEIMNQMSSTNDNAPLIDSFGRVHTSFRISVTDRCNLRCFYCMPEEKVRFRPRNEILSYEEIERFVRIVSRQGIRKVRISGGEPLVRTDLWRLVERLSSIKPIKEVALTTNGMLLSQQAQKLKDAGLSRLNISLDTLNEDTFRKIARRDGLDLVLDGIAAAERVGFENIKLNALSIRGLAENEIVPLAEFARKRELELRFIEFMPLDAGGQWQTDDVLSGGEVRKILEAALGPLVPLPRGDASLPAVEYRFASGGGKIGFINSVTEPFCDQCNRLRLTAEGKIRNCLFSKEEWDVRQFLRHEDCPPRTVDKQVMDRVRVAVSQKKAGHGIGTAEFIPPQRSMHQIGG